MIKSALLVLVMIAVVAGGVLVMVTKKIVPSRTTTVVTPTTTYKPSETAAEPTLNTQKNQLTLSVTSPINNTTVTSASLVIRGMTIAGAEISVNDIDVKADRNGVFSAAFILDEGENYIIIVATDDNGNVAEQELNITYTSVE